MPLELAQIVAELVEPIALLRQIEGSENGIVDLPSRPTADLRAAMQEHFEQADDARLLDLEAGIAHRTDGDRAGEALEQREVDMDVEPLGLITGEAVGDRLEGGADGVELIEPLLEAEVIEVVGAELVAQEGRELLVLLDRKSVV